MSSVSRNNTFNRLRKSKVLLDKLKSLQDRFVQVASTTSSSSTVKNNDDDNTTTTNNNNKNDIVFPLFPPKIQQRIWKQYGGATAASSSTMQDDQQLPSQQQQQSPLLPRQAAAILVPLISYEGEPSLLFTTRANHLSSHASQISYPGGHYDSAVDSSLVDTAIRETQEELVYIPPNNTNTNHNNNNNDDDYPWDEIIILGPTSTVPSMKGIPVTPIIGIFPYEMDRTTIFRGSPQEVQDVFCVSIQELLEIESTEPNERFQSNIPVYITKDGGKKIWGFTAVVTRPLLHNLFQPIFFPQYTKPNKLFVKAKK
jgi:hypothetical protein